MTLSQAPGPLGRRISQAVLSQVAFALSNALVTLVAAWQLEPAEFGSVSIALLIFLLLRGPLVGSIGHASIVTHAAESPDHVAKLMLAAMTRAASLGLVPALAGVLYALAGYGPQWLVPLALLFPALISYEVVRIMALGLDRQQLAAKADLVWLALQAAGTAAALLIWPGQQLAVVLPWAFGGVFAAAMTRSVLRSQAGSCADIDLEIESGLATTFFIDDVLANGIQRSTLAASAIVVSTLAVAQVRLALVLFNAVLVVGAAMQPLILRRFRQEYLDLGAPSWRTWRLYTATIGALTAATLVCLVTVSHLVGQSLGPNFAAAGSFFGWIALLRASDAAAVAASSMIKSDKGARRSDLLAPRAFQGITTAALVLALGFTYEASGLAAGLALGTTAGAIGWLKRARDLLRNSDS